MPSSGIRRVCIQGEKGQPVSAKEFVQQHTGAQKCAHQIKMSENDLSATARLGPMGRLEYPIPMPAGKYVA